MPSPVYSHEFDVIGQAFPIPPVAITTDFALNTTKRPVSRQYASAPAHRPPSVSSRTIVHSMYTSNPMCTPRSCSVRIISSPVRSPTWHNRRNVCPPNARCKVRPSSVRSNSAPHCSSSITRSGASCACNCAMRQLFSIFPPRTVSRKCGFQPSAESTLAIAAAIPPSAITVCALPNSDLLTTPTEAPCPSASIAARNPAPPAPTTSTSCSCVSNLSLKRSSHLGSRQTQPAARTGPPIPPKSSSSTQTTCGAHSISLAIATPCTSAFQKSRTKSNP